LNARDGVVASYSALPSPDFWATKGAAQYLELEECSINEITDDELTAAVIIMTLTVRRRL